MAPTEILSIPNDGGNLDAFNPEQGESAPDNPLMVVVQAGAPPPLPAAPAPFSRLEAAQARRERRTARTLSQRRATMQRAGAQVERAAASAVGYSLALCALIALRGDSFAHFAGRASADASRSTRRAGLAMAHLSSAGLRTVARTAAHATSLGRNYTRAIHGMVGAERTRRHASSARAEERALRHLESEGSLVAIGLAVVAIGYGSLLLISWRHPETTVSTSPVATAHLAAVDTTSVAPTQAIVAVTPLPPDRAVEARPRVRVMNASTLNTIWRRNDTRSLQQAFAGLRRETLAFHRCSMKMTAADRAVAQCDGVAGRVVDGEGAAPRATWTFDFQRTGGRWAIRRVTNR